MASVKFVELLSGTAFERNIERLHDILLFSNNLRKMNIKMRTMRTLLRLSVSSEINLLFLNAIASPCMSVSARWLAMNSSYNRANISFWLKSLFEKLRKIWRRREETLFLHYRTQFWRNRFHCELKCRDFRFPFFAIWFCEVAFCNKKSLFLFHVARTLIWKA